MKKYIIILGLLFVLFACSEQEAGHYMIQPIANYSFHGGKNGHGLYFVFASSGGEYIKGALHRDSNRRTSQG